MPDQNEVLRYIESMLATPNGMTNSQLANRLIQQCPTVDPALIKTLVDNEVPKMAASPTYQLNWAAYSIPSPEQLDNTPAINTEL